MIVRKRRIASSAAMVNFGMEFGGIMVPGLTIYLDGDLGVGKTTLVKGILRGMGYTKAVRSPTFNLYLIYQMVTWQVIHVDLYRIKAPEELESIGLVDYFDGTSICLVEWPQCGKNFLPRPDIYCEFNFRSNFRERELEIVSHSPRGESIINSILEL